VVEKTHLRPDLTSNSFKFREVKKDKNAPSLPLKSHRSKDINPEQYRELLEFHDSRYVYAQP